MTNTLLIAAVFLSVVLAAVIAVQRVKYKNLVQQTQKSMQDLQEKEQILQKEAMIKAKEALQNEREQLNEDERERRREFAAIETKLNKREDMLENKIQEITDKETELDKMKDKLIEREDLLDELINKHTAELERIAGMSAEEAKRMLLEQLKSDLAQEQMQLIRENEAKIREDALEKSKEILSTTIQRCMMDQVVESTVSVVSLPNDEMKGRIIGREGRNIRTLETLTGVDLIIDDTPEALVVSSFDPLRREIARVTLETLIKDGRIHPTRIEELYDKTVNDMKAKVLEYGNNALFELGITKMDPELVEILGKLHFRTSFGQNALTHSLEVGFLSGVIAAELGENVALARRAGLLHDIGKSIDHEVEGSHVTLGAELAKKYKENEVVINAIESHHGDTEATSIIASIVAIADALSASRPGARNDSLENYVQRLKDLEAIADEIDGVEKSYAVQAGRELRVLVKSEEIDDLTTHKVARDIKNQIEENLQYPGTIKVTVIRETRVVEEAK